MTERVSMTLRMPNRVNRLVEVAARLDKKSKNQIIIDAVEEYLERYKSNPEYQARLREMIADLSEGLQ